jgi:AraC-like DNA-binding protein
MFIRNRRLPAMPFGERQAQLFRQPSEYADRMAGVMSGINAYEPMGDRRNFFAKAAGVDLPDLRIVASVTSPVYIDVGDSQDVTLLFPLAGNNHCSIGRSSFDYGVGQGAMFLPATARRGHGDWRSMLLLDLKPAILERTARSMFGAGEDSSVALRLHEPRTMPLRIGGVELSIGMQQLCRLVDAYDGSADLLHRVGLSDMVYRHVVIMLRPDLVAQDPGAGARKPGDAQRILDEVCAILSNRLTERITLTDIERISGLSARVLQYAFQRRYGCSPMDWLRDQRLLRAREDLLHGRAHSVAQVAAEYAFPSASRFAAVYRERFGETPAASLRATRGA